MGGQTIRKGARAASTDMGELRAEGGLRTLGQALVLGGEEEEGPTGNKWKHDAKAEETPATLAVPI